MRINLSNFIVAAALCLAGCGGDNTPNNTVTSDGGSIPTNLTSIYSVNFQSAPLGTYSRSLLNQDWGSPFMSINGIDEGRVTVVPEDTNKEITVKYPAGSCGPNNSDGCGKGGGAQWLMPLDANYNELYLSYKLKFSNDFNFVQGGKLPGLTGSQNAASSMPPTGDNKPGECGGFSARFMWKANGAMETYLYSPAQPGTYGEDLPWQNPNGTPVQLLPAKWYTVTERLVMNTPGIADGILEIWVDGVKVQNKTNIFYRGAACTTLGVNQIYFSTFFGGNDSSWAAVKDEYTLFDDFIISRP